MTHQAVLSVNVQGRSGQGMHQIMRFLCQLWAQELVSCQRMQGLALLDQLKRKQVSYCFATLPLRLVHTGASAAGSCGPNAVLVLLQTLLCV